MYHASIPLHNLDDLLAKIAEQQEKLRNTCPCGAPGKVYADDGRTALCGRCWLRIYGRVSDANA
jgi:hypothetical protein